MSQVQIIEPQNGEVVEGAVLTSTIRRFGPCDNIKVSQRCNGSTCNPDFGGAAIGRIGQQEYVVVIPQNSFLTCGNVVTSTNLHFFRFENGAIQRTDVTVGERPGGATVQRSMLAFGKLGASDTKSALVFSKDLLFVFDPKTGAALAVRDVTAPNTLDVLNSPGNTQMSTPRGRRYGQFRLVNIVGGARQEIVVAAHSLPKAKNQDPLALHGMYTTYPTIQAGSAGFIQPVWGPPGALGNDVSRYRFFKDATKKADDKTEALQRFTFLNGALLFGGTPPNGIDDLGDGGISIVVSDAPPTAVPATTPMLYVLDAVNGADKLNFPYAGAVALDVLKMPFGPARIVVWGGLAAGQDYANGRLQALRYDPSEGH